MMFVSSADLEISNLKRQIEIQNSILEAILEEMRIRNEKADKLIELQKERNFDLKEIAKQYY